MISIYIVIMLMAMLAALTCGNLVDSWVRPAILKWLNDDVAIHFTKATWMVGGIPNDVPVQLGKAVWLPKYVGDGIRLYITADEIKFGWNGKEKDALARAIVEVIFIGKNPNSKLLEVSIKPIWLHPSIQKESFYLMFDWEKLYTKNEEMRICWKTIRHTFFYGFLGLLFGGSANADNLVLTERGCDQYEAMVRTIASKAYIGLDPVMGREFIINDPDMLNAREKAQRNTRIIIDMVETGQEPKYIALWMNTQCKQEAVSNLIKQ